MDAIWGEGSLLDALADASRRAIVADPVGRALLGNIVTRLLTETSEATPLLGRLPEHHDPRKTADTPRTRVAKHHSHNPAATGPQAHPMPPGTLDVGAIFDIMVGVADYFRFDASGRELALDAVLKGIVIRGRLTDGIHALAQDILKRREDPQMLPQLLGLRRHGQDLLGILNHRRLLKLPSHWEVCARLMQSLVATGVGPLMPARRYETDPANSARIISVMPSPVCENETVTIRADSTLPFDSVPPPGVVVVFGCTDPAVVAGVQSWSATEVKVKVPPAARTGPVYFAITKDNAVAAAMIEQREKAVKALVAECPHLGGNSLIYTTYTGAPTKSFPPACVMFADGRNELTVQHRPFILNLEVKDAHGTLGWRSVTPCTPLTANWDVVSDDGTPPMIKVTLPGGAFHMGLPAQGTLSFTAPASGPFQLQATNGCGSRMMPQSVQVTMELTFAERIVCLAAGQKKDVTLALPCNVTSPLTVNLQSSHPPRVSVPNSVTIPANARSVTITVTGQVAAGPGTETASITATAAGMGTARLSAWVENPMGQWGHVGDTLSVIAIHAALLPTGKVLFFSGDEVDYNNIEKGKAEMWNPLNGQSQTLPFPSPRNLFCSGHAFLPDGRLAIFGGHAYPGAGRGADHDVHTFDPASATFTRHADMAHARWYPTCATLPDGTVMAVAGAAAGAPGGWNLYTWGGLPINREAEFLQPDNGQRQSSTAFQCDCEFLLYPFMHVLPGGRLFVHGQWKTWIYDATAANDTGFVQGLEYATRSPNSRTYPVQAGCTVLPLRDDEPNRVRILVAGGGDERVDCQGHETEATNTTEIFDYNPTLASSTPQPGWRWGPALGYRRFMSDTVLMADGNVLIVGGVAKGVADNNALAVRQTELFDSQSETVRPVASITVDRRYHSTALLLPDGRILSAGSTGAWPPSPSSNERKIEAYSPPYLFCGPRPVVVGAPGVLGYGVLFSFDIEYPTLSPRLTDAASEISFVTLVRLGSATHTINTDQRCLRLTVQSAAGGRVTVRAPSDRAAAPPGYYMLFAVDRRGVPSRAAMLRLG